MVRGDERRVRVLMVGQGPPTRGGIPSFVAGLLEDPVLASKAEVRYLNTTPSRTKRPGALDVGNATDAVRHAWRVFRRSRGVDVVHLHLSPVPALPLLRAALLAAAARAAGARVVLHAHTGRLHDAVGRRGYRAVLRVALRFVDVLIVVSGVAESALRDQGVAGAVKIPNGVHVDGFATGPKADPPVLAFVGTVCERKGLLDLRDALLALGDARPRVRIVGDAVQEGPGEFERIVRAYREAGLEAVAFEGALSADAVRALLAEAAIFCLPSHWEGGPLSLLEAMAAGAAVVATTVGDIPEMLAGGEAGLLVPPKDPPALAAALRSLLEDPALRTRLGEAARRRALAHHDRSALTASLLAVYAGLVRGERPGH